MRSNSAAPSERAFPVALTMQHSPVPARDNFQLLAATYVDSRGVHVDDGEHVINYDIPQISEDIMRYVGHGACKPR